MKPIRLIFTLAALCVSTAYANSDDTWRLVCPTDQEQCQTLWSKQNIPDTAGNIMVAYNVHYDRLGQPNVSFIVNINQVKLHPEIDMIIVYTDKENVLPIPIAARDATGVTAEFDNIVTINKLLTK